MNKNSPQTPFEEAVSIICIASILVGLGCYLAAINGVRFVSAKFVINHKIIIGQISIDIHEYIEMFIKFMFMF